VERLQTSDAGDDEMIDKELLELAAKAAGVECKKTPIGFYLLDEDRNWNPLTDDGDALRLAVKLKIDVKHYDDYVVGWFDGGYIGTGKIMYEGEPYAATRRAITRAAAAIGKAMP
jgi:hypothetical protein